jgi:hypothetical protein
MLLYFAIAAIITFIATVSKNIGLCILFYLALSFGFSIIGAIFQVAAAFLDPSTTSYSVVEFFNAFNIYTSTAIGTGTTYTAKQVLYILMAPATLSALSIFLGIKIFAKKNLK